MKYREMPTTGDKLSILGYGCMRFPTRLGVIDKEKALRQVRLAIDSGVNYLDTAWPYHFGTSETFLGEQVLKDGYRERVKVATKLPCYLVNKPEDMVKFVNGQLKRLQVEQIDYYLLHALDGVMWQKMLSLGIIDFMEQIKREGKIANMGFSYHGTKQDFTKIIDDYDWDFTQVQYNLLDEDFQAGSEGIDYAASKGIGVIVMEPLRGGTLVGEIPQEVQRLWNAAPIQRTPAEWALRWVWNNPNVQVVLSGMTLTEHVKENIAIAETALPEAFTKEETEVIEKVKRAYHQLLAVRCTSCRYCLPCPAGINIPYAFQTLNRYHMFGKKFKNRMWYLSASGRGEKTSWTSNCLDCGKCEQRCPQEINIRAEFKQVQRDIETPIAKGLIRLIKPFL